jgi:hypothetical protein
MIERHWKDADNFFAVTAGRGFLASTNKIGKNGGRPESGILRNSAFYFHAGKT